MKTTSLPSVEERKEELRTYFDKLLKPKKPTMKNLDREILADWLDNVLTQDRNQAYTRLVEGIKAQVENINGEGSVFDDFATDILENVVKPLYGKTGDKAVDANY